MRGDAPSLGRPLWRPLWAAGACAVVLCTASGCVRRTITITSDPAGALVILNDREVGRTPVEVDFTYYGTYDVRLHKEGFEPFVGSAEASPPVWDSIPLDLASELVPADLHARVAWHFILAPSQSEGLIERATEMRGAVEQAGDQSNPPPSPASPASPAPTASNPEPGSGLSSSSSDPAPNAAPASVGGNSAAAAPTPR